MFISIWCDICNVILENLVTRLPELSNNMENECLAPTFELVFTDQSSEI